MDKYQQQYLQALRTQSSFYRRTARGHEPGAADYVGSMSPYLYDVFTMCAGSISELELRQFMPPASLQAALACLLELGLIECVPSRVRCEPAHEGRAANRRMFVPAPMAA